MAVNMIKFLSKLFLIVLIPILMCHGCASRESRNTIKAMCKSELKLPSDMLEIIEGKVRPYQDDNIDKGLMVIYYDKAECGSCRISKLNMLDTLYRLSETSGKFNMLVVFSPKDEELEEILSLLTAKQYPYPVVLDISGEFSRLNSFVPEDSRFHSFLTDTNRKPIFIGNPLYSTELWNIFIKKINK